MSYQFTKASSQALEATPGTFISDYPFSISAWAKSTDLATSQSIAMLGTSVSSRFSDARFKGAVAGDPLSAFTSNTSNVSANTTIGYSSGTWHHVCAVFTSSTLREIYIDGGSRGETLTSLAIGNAYDKVSVGGVRTTVVGAYLQGNVAEVGVYAAHALSASEIASLAAGKAPKLVSKPNLTYYWPLKADGGLTDEIASLTLAAVNGPVYAADHPSITYASGFAAGHHRWWWYGKRQRKLVKS